MLVYVGNLCSYLWWNNMVSGSMVFIFPLNKHEVAYLQACPQANK